MADLGTHWPISTVFLGVAVSNDVKHNIPTSIKLNYSKYRVKLQLDQWYSLTKFFKKKDLNFYASKIVNDTRDDTW